MTNPRSKSQERRLAVQRNPTPETCRELADKLERYCENMTPAEWIVSGSHWLEAFIHRVVGPWIDGKSKTGINGEEVEYVAEKMKMERCDASFAADCRNNADSIIAALRGYAAAAGEIERLRGYVSAIHRGILGQEPFENVLADADAERCRHRAITLAAEAKWLRSEVVGLRAENARLSAAAGERWIPVSERLPKHHGDVILCGPSLPSTPGYMGGGGEWFCLDNSPLEGSRTPTHWQPLPEPPAGSKESEVRDE